MIPAVLKFWGMKLVRVVLLAALFAHLTAMAFAAEPLLHHQAPRFVRKDLNRRVVDLKAFRGKVVLLNFWATWCAPCLTEMPRFVEWQRRYGDRGLQVIGISMDDESGPVTKVSTKLHLNYPVAMGDEQIGELYGGVLGLPVSFLIDRDGEIAAVYRGEASLDEIESQIQSLLDRQRNHAGTGMISRK